MVFGVSRKYVRVKAEGAGHWSAQPPFDDAWIAYSPGMERVAPTDPAPATTWIFVVADLPPLEAVTV